MQHRAFSAVAIVCALIFALMIGTADAKPRHHHRHHTRGIVDANGNRAGLVTVPTAAGINITAAPAFASKMQGFIADIVAAGYRPPRIKCFSLSKSHVRNSLHFRGEACDFNQHGWGKTDRFMYRVAAIAARHGLRDGCTFRDCGHIDSGRGIARAPWPRVFASEPLPSPSIQ
jgi:hypothetical protein